MKFTFFFFFLQHLNEILGFNPWAIDEIRSFILWSFDETRNFFFRDWLMKCTFFFVKSRWDENFREIWFCPWLIDEICFLFLDRMQNFTFFLCDWLLEFAVLFQERIIKFVVYLTSNQRKFLGFFRGHFHKVHDQLRKVWFIFIATWRTVLWKSAKKINNNTRHSINSWKNLMPISIVYL